MGQLAFICVSIMEVTVSSAADLVSGSEMESGSKRRRVDDYEHRLRQLVVLQLSFARDFLHLLPTVLTITVLLCLTDGELRVAASVSKKWQSAMRACNVSARLVRALAERNWSAGITTVVSLGRGHGGGCHRFNPSWCTLLSDPHAAVHWWLAIAARPLLPQPQQQQEQDEQPAAGPVCLYRRSILSPPATPAELVGHLPVSAAHAAARPHCDQLVTLTIEASAVGGGEDGRVRVWRMTPRERPAAWAQEATWLLKDVDANDCALPILRDPSETDSCLVVVTSLNEVHVYTPHGVKLVHIHFVCPLGRTYASSARILPASTEKQKPRRRLQLTARDHRMYHEAKSAAVVVVDLPDAGVSGFVGPSAISSSSLSDSLYALANGKAEYYWKLNLSSGSADLVTRPHVFHRWAATIIEELAERKCTVATPAQPADAVLCWDQLRDVDGWRPRPVPAVVGVHHSARLLHEQVTDRGDLLVVEHPGDYKTPRRASLHALDHRQDGSACLPRRRALVQHDELAVIDAVDFCWEHDWAVLATGSTAGIIDCGPSAWVLHRWATDVNRCPKRKLPDVHVKPPAFVVTQSTSDLDSVAVMSTTSLFLYFASSRWGADQVEDCCGVLLHVLPVVPLLYC